MPAAEQLPEGTDSIIEGAGISGDDDFETEVGTPPAASGESDAAVLSEGFVPQDTANTAKSDGNDKDGGNKSGSGEPAGGAPTDIKTALFGRIDEVRGQAGDKARDLAQAGKDRATAALDDLVRMVEDAASEIDGRLGSQYGDYARRAAEGIGSFSQGFKDKDVDDIFDEARELVKKAPGVAVGVAAALGFVVARLVRAGIPDQPGGSDKSEAAS